MKKTAVSVIIAVIFAVMCSAGITANAADTTRTSLAAAEVVTSYESYSYRFKEVTPKVKVYLTVNEKRKRLTQDEDYKVTYSDNINAGTATITVKGINDYKGKAYGSFEITPLSLKSEDVSFTALNKAYAGTAPRYSVKYKSHQLVEGTDYTFTAENYSKAGYRAAKVKFKGIGNFVGSKSLKTSVYPHAVSGLKINSVKGNSVSLSWNSLQGEGVTAYRVYETNYKGYVIKRLAEVSSNSATVSISAGKVTYFRVCAVVNGNSSVTGDYSNTVSVSSKPGKTVSNYVARVSKKKILISWKATSCSGYQIAYSADKKFKSKVNYVYANKNSTSKRFRVKKANKNYYVRIRAYTKVGKAKKFGKWSKAYPSDFEKLYEFYSSYYVNKPNRTKNLKLASKKVDGTIVYPGQVFSFNDTVGPRTAERGYKPAPVFIGADKTEDGIGGGICQVATTIYNAALYCNFDIVERYQHSQKVAYCPLGRDAAIYWRSEDVKFKNTSKYPVKIRMYCSDGKLTCKIFTTGPKKAPKVTLTVQQNGDTYTLKRHVNGGVNYTATSKY